MPIGRMEVYKRETRKVIRRSLRYVSGFHYVSRRVCPETQPKSDPIPYHLENVCLPPICESNAAGQLASQNNIPSDGWVELDGTPPETVETVYAVRRLRRLPPSPSRSLGGYLDYAGWPDRERFMELDLTLKRKTE
jgi:hypothetical protein